MEPPHIGDEAPRDVCSLRDKHQIKYGNLPTLETGLRGLNTVVRTVLSFAGAKKRPKPADRGMTRESKGT